MAMSKVQCQRGLSMLELFDTYGSQEDCEALGHGWRWSARVSRSLTRFLTAAVLRVKRIASLPLSRMWQ